MRKLLVAISCLLTVNLASAWNSVGHRTIAELVWRNMNKSERKAATELLQQHPHYHQLLAANIPAGVNRDEWVFLAAAVWPDWVRPAKKGQPHKPESITKYNLYPHGIGYPFLKAGETNRALLDNFYIAKPNAEMVLSNSIAILKDSKASPADRAVSLCWVLHLMGDLHQPLHAANRVTSEHPRGEGLGGDHFVLDSRGREVSLHSFWDQLPGVDQSYNAVAGLADELQSNKELKPTKLKEYRESKTIEAWVQESYHAAVDFAYAEDKIQFVYLKPTKSEKKELPTLPSLTADFEQGAKKIAQRRLVLAGQRATDVIKSVW